MAFDGPIWEGVYSSFSEVPVTGPGFDGEAWVNNSLNKIRTLREDAEKNTPLPPPSNYREGLLPLLAALVYSEQKELRILDFGGGIGFTYYQTLYALPRTRGLEYHIVEQETVCQAGREFFIQEADRLFFHVALEEVRGTFDIVHIGSALHYVKEWRTLLANLCALSPKYLLLVDVLTGNITTFATAQHYYNSRIPTWFLNIAELLEEVNSLGYDLTYKSKFHSTIFGAEQSIPMGNFDHKYRIDQTCNLLFLRR